MKEWEAKKDVERAESAYWGAVAALRELGNDSAGVGEARDRLERATGALARARYILRGIIAEEEGR